jgi:hypothetical protein
MLASNTRQSTSSASPDHGYSKAPSVAMDGHPETNTGAAESKGNADPRDISTLALVQELQIRRHAPERINLGWSNIPLPDTTPHDLVLAIEGWIRSKQLPPSIRSRSGRLNMRDIDTLVFLKKLKAKATHPSLFERAFKEVFSTPGLAATIARRDDLTKFGSHAGSSWLVSRLPLEGCPLSPSWGPHTMRRLIRWITNRCSLSPSDFDNYFEPMVARMKSGLYWNEFCSRNGLLSASNLPVDARATFDRPQLDTNAVLLSLLEDKYSRVFRPRSSSAVKENLAPTGSRLIDRFDVGAFSSQKRLIDRFDDGHRSLLSRIEG